MSFLEDNKPCATRKYNFLNVGEHSAMYESPCKHCDGSVGLTCLISCARVYCLYKFPPQISQAVKGPNVGAFILSYTILGVPYCTYSITKRLQYPLVREYTLNSRRILNIKVFSLIQGYWSLWEYTPKPYSCVWEAAFSRQGSHR